MTDGWMDVTSVEYKTAEKKMELRTEFFLPHFLLSAAALLLSPVYPWMTNELACGGYAPSLTIIRPQE